MESRGSFGFCRECGILWNAQIHDSCDVVGKACVQPSTNQVLAASEEVSVPRFEKRSRKSEDQRLHVTLLIFAPG